MTASREPSPPAPPVVITGAGLVTGLGLSREQTWQQVLRGRCAMGPLGALEQPLPPGRDGGQAPDLPADFEPGASREIRYLRRALDEALHDAGFGASLPYPPPRRACLLGTTLHGMRAAGRFLRGEADALSEFLAGSTLAAATRGLELAGLRATTCSACSSSLGSVALAVTLLQSGRADLVIAGGYDTISEYVYGGFNSLRLVAEGPLRPFSRGRQGMKLAEGYGIVVLERAADAAARGAEVLATVAGWGESADAHHLTQPHPQGDGAARAIEAAMARAGVGAGDIDLIAAHGTGTPDNDAGEYAAFSRAFGPHLADVPVVAFKSHLGHTLGGAGAVELILSALALRDQVVPACANVTDADVEFPGLRVATGASRPAPIRHTLNTSLGFGGANTCVVLGPASGPAASAGAVPVPPLAASQKGEAESRVSLTGRSTVCDAASGTPRDVFITGVGVLLPGVVGNDALLARITSAGEASTETPVWRHDRAAIPESDLDGLLNARRVRRMSDYVKYTLAATTLACRDAGIADVAAFAETCAAVLGTTHGAASYSGDYYQQIVKEGLAAANPLLFAEGVPNVGAAQLSLMLSLKGACQTVIGTRTAGLDALALAAARIAAGDWDRAFVSAGEERGELVMEAYRRCGLRNVGGGPPFGGGAGFVDAPGAVTLVLESRQSMERRGGGRARGRVRATAAASGDRAHAAETVARVLGQLGSPANVVSSACGTWVDRAEAAALRRDGGARVVSSIYGHAAETFSASPLVALAAALLSGRMPRLVGGGWQDAGPDGGADGAMRAATGGEPAADFAVLCTDFTGTASGVRVAGASPAATATSGGAPVGGTA